MSDPEREHELSKDCWCQPTLDGDAPDGVSLEDQIEHQRSIYDGDTETFGTESEWTIKSGSILASLLELQLRRDSAPAADTVLVPVEPNQEMLDAGDALLDDTVECSRNVWDAMLRAAKEES